MKFKSITPEEAQKLHPQEVNNIITKLRRSSSKEKKADIESLSFSYEYCVKSAGPSINGDDYFKMVAGEMPFPEHKPKPETAEERANEYLPRVSMSLVAKIGRWWGAEPVDHPSEFKSFVLAQFGKEIALEKKEQTRQAAMTDEEKAQETAELLKQLGKFGGSFIGFRH